MISSVLRCHVDPACVIRIKLVVNDTVLFIELSFLFLVTKKQFILQEENSILFITC